MPLRLLLVTVPFYLVVQVKISLHVNLYAEPGQVPNHGGPTSPPKFRRLVLVRSCLG
jgi:hypothetical protein